ncbi:MAG: glycerate kinase [Burkholderiaceae bacterium]|nr:glycerate kinase [Burkholderiaceae bacterium]
MSGLDGEAAQRLLRRMFDAALQVAMPAHGLPAQLPPPPPPGGRTVVIGAGKAAAAMAQCLERHWPGPLQGLVVTRYGHGLPCQRIEVLEAAHPVPDAAGERAARRMLQQVQGLGADDLVICLLSGGGSALLALPLPGITLEHKQQLHRALLASGASIAEMNCVRRHLSAIKGGRLAAACHPARLVNLLISDVPGDRAEDIASGPSVPDPTTREQAQAVLARHAIALPAAVRRVLDDAALSETLKPGDARLPVIESRWVATPQQALEAAARVGREAGLAVHILGDALEGEASAMGRTLGGIALQVARRGQPFATPCVLLSGGEATVQVRGSGRGGRNVEFLLSLALSLQGQAQIHALAADTDGVDGLDGSQPLAGALLAPDSLARAERLGLRAADFLHRNDAHSFFEALGDSLLTGPTLTNVNDFRAILVA